jgi:hypothetical protein
MLILEPVVATRLPLEGMAPKKWDNSRMKRYEPAPKWDGRKWRPAVDVFDDRPGKHGKTTIKGGALFETREEALKESLKLLPPKAAAQRE